jgi:hypothetical protein
LIQFSQRVCEPDCQRRSNHRSEDICNRAPEMVISEILQRPAETRWLGHRQEDGRRSVTNGQIRPPRPGIASISAQIIRGVVLSEPASHQSSLSRLYRCQTRHRRPADWPWAAWVRLRCQFNINQPSRGAWTRGDGCVVGSRHAWTRVERYIKSWARARAGSRGPK